jgi:translocation and assembly module TamA
VRALKKQPTSLAVEASARVRWCNAAWLAALLQAAAPAHGAALVGYSVLMQTDMLEPVLRESSLLVTLQPAGRIAPFTLVQRAQEDDQRLKAVLESAGYYAGTIRITVAGKAAADPALPATLEALPPESDTTVVIGVSSGALYHLGKVELRGQLPAREREAFPLRSGQPAAAALVVDAQSGLLAALQEDGYAFARVDLQPAIIDDSNRALDVRFDVTAGPQAHLGTLAFHGLQDVNESFVRGALELHSGDQYKPSAIESARQTLAALGVFSDVSVRAVDTSMPRETVDLVFDVQERQMHTVTLSAAYFTDRGASVSAQWTHRNLLGNAEQLDLLASATDIGGTASNGVGYDLSATFTKPRFLDENQILAIALSAVKQDLDAYSQTAQTLDASVRRKLSAFWSGSAGIAIAHDEVTQEGVTRLYQLVSLPMTASYDSVHLSSPLSDPDRGYRGTVSVTPEVALGHTGNPVFVILEASGSAYFSLTDSGGTVVALRALIASIQGASSLDVPPDRRLYVGGSGTVRGFRYQSIGPRFPDQNPIGASAVDAGSVELRQRIDEDWGATLFVDAGQAGTTSVPFTGDLNVGVGLGANYYTPVGAIRASIAVPVTQYDNRDSFEIYIGLGQAF